jgi:mono/diheme cytochrome c family protein
MKAGKVSRMQARLQPRIGTKRMKAAVLVLLSLLLFTACGGGADTDASEEAVPADPVAAEGQKVFKQNCGSCHAITADTTIVGPSLAGIASRAGTRVEGQSAEEYIHLSILRPDEYIVTGFSDLMPTNFGTTLSGEQLDALIVYLMTLE